MKKIILSAEARSRIARQVAENVGLTVVCGDQRAAPSNLDHFTA